VHITIPPAKQCVFHRPLLTHPLSYTPRLADLPRFRMTGAPATSPQSMSQAPWQFLATSSPAERRALLASTLGWMLDGMDVTLYAMVIAELLRELQLTPTEAGLLASLTLIASAAGGILFGILADRSGRRRALMASILVYSVFTAACGFSRTVTELAVFRLLLGLGMGGEWATGAALVAETWRAEHRGKALGLMQSGFAIGYALAAVVTALVLPRWGWRAVFFVGLLPALVTLWIRQGVEESPVWTAQVRTKDVAMRSDSRASLFSLGLASRHRRSILVTLLMNAAALFGWWGLFTWIPPYLALPADQGGRGLTIAASSLWIVAMQVGMWLGYVTFGFVSDALGQKRTYVTYLLLAAALVPFYARAQAPATLLLLGPLVAFFGTGHFTGFGVISAELFPTSFRASAMGLTYNFGRALSAAAPWLMGWVAERRSLNSAFWISGVAFLLAGLIALGIPQTRGRSLTDDPQPQAR
jgi:MFS family permease